MRCTLRPITLVLGATLLTYAAIAQTPKPPDHQGILENMEWTWEAQPDGPNPTLPNVLLLGGSITRGCYPDVRKLLSGRANCYLFATSAASGDPTVKLRVN